MGEGKSVLKWIPPNFFRKRNPKKSSNTSKRGIPTTKSPKSSDVHPLQFRRLRGWWRGEINLIQTEKMDV